MCPPLCCLWHPLFHSVPEKAFDLLFSTISQLQAGIEARDLTILKGQGPHNTELPVQSRNPEF